ncbi:hypothetical protein [Hymenobacter bucti]|uniref:DUF4328 domain-containing protein n=1 Tax=Hymenobacter bucti TaxID=1844114 RepID=A0ABW4R136_9BACT
MKNGWHRLGHAQALSLVLAVLGLGVAMRVGHFPSVPPGLNPDEAANAYSLAETGANRWGNYLPAYFPVWGSGQNVLLAYLTVPVVKALGLNLWLVRLVPLLLGLLPSWFGRSSLVSADHYLFRHPQGAIRVQFNDGLAGAFAAVGRLQGVPQMLITSQISLNYVYALYYLRYPPARFQQAVRREVVDGSY